MESVHPDDRPRVRRVRTESYDARRAFTIEYRLRRQDGQYRWLFDRGVPRFGPDGEFAGYIGSAVDVTERKQAEERYQTIVETANEGVWLIAPDGRTVYANDRMASLLGCSPGSGAGTRRDRLLLLRGCGGGAAAHRSAPGRRGRPPSTCASARRRSRGLGWFVPAPRATRRRVVGALGDVLRRDRSPARLAALAGSEERFRELAENLEGRDLGLRFEAREPRRST